jgi:putative membrane protein
MLTTPAYAYLIFLVSALVLLGLFAVVYSKITAFDEMELIRAGNGAATLSYCGALVGFSLTLYSSIATHASYEMFLAWAAGAMVTQVVSYSIVARVIRGMNQAIHDNNMAMGGLMGGISLSVGIINAACLT